EGRAAVLVAGLDDDLIDTGRLIYMVQIDSAGVCLADKVGRRAVTPVDADGVRPDTAAQEDRPVNFLLGWRAALSVDAGQLHMRTELRKGGVIERDRHGVGIRTG